MNEQDEIKWLKGQLEAHSKLMFNLYKQSEIEQSRIARLSKQIADLEAKIASYQAKIKAYSEAVKNLNVAIYDIR